MRSEQWLSGRSQGRLLAGASAAILALATGGLMPATALAQGQNIDGIKASGEVVQASGPWTLLPKMPQPVQDGEAWIRPERGQALHVDVDAMRALLANAPLESAPGAWDNALLVEIPHPDGTMSLFRVVESPVIDEQLRAEYPLIRTYLGQGVTVGAETMRMDVTPVGVRVQVLGPDGSWYIDPYTRGDNAHSTSFFKRDLTPMGDPFQCLMFDDGMGATPPRPFGTRNIGPTLRTYDLAITTTGEYSAFHGGTTASVLAAVTTVVNRVTGIYEREIGVRLVLVAGSTATFFLNAATDPYATPGPNTTTMNAAQAQFDTLIGAANYDVGHLFHRAGNSGVAGAIGNVCVAGGKGRGVSQTEPPVGDVFSVDYVAHELGHQFGGRHTFNNCSGGPGDAAAIAHEPGSGSTIMAYAGICGSNNIQPNSDAMFASINFDQMTAYVAGAANPCATATATGNNAPNVINAFLGTADTVPAGTPLYFNASTTDPDGDVLTFGWEQRNGGPAVALTSFVDNGSSPIARVFNPTTSPVRYMPRISSLVGSSPVASLGETVPTTNRTMNWRITARDNRAGGGGVRFADVAITSTTAAGPFTVTLPTGAVTWNGGTSREVRWNVANTNVAPVNTATVDILLSTDGGLTFPTVLVAATPNDGSQFVTVPNTPTTQGVIMVRAVNNYFFNVHRGGFVTIVAPSPGVDIQANATLPSAVLDNTGNGNNNGLAEPGESAIGLRFTLRNDGLTPATSVQGSLTSSTSGVTIVNGTSPWPSLPILSSGSDNTTPFTIALAPTVPCGTVINLTLTVTSNGPTRVFNYTLITGTPGGPSPTLTRVVYTGAPVAIPDNNTTGASASVTASGIVGALTEVDFSFDGTVCNATVGATTVGLDHTFVGDLVITLTSPAGTSVTLSNRRGGGGNNLCNTRFEDSAATPISSIVAAGNPWTGSFRPETPMSAFNGQTGNGVWTVRVVDAAGSDIGSIRAFSVWLRGQSSAVCQPPLPGGPTCDSTDFNQDGDFPTPLDLEDFINANAGSVCGTCSTDLDFNNDGDFPTPLDVEAFISVLGGGPCL